MRSLGKRDSLLYQARARTPRTCRHLSRGHCPMRQVPCQSFSRRPTLRYRRARLTLLQIRPGGVQGSCSKKDSETAWRIVPSLMLPYFSLKRSSGMTALAMER